MRASWWIVIEPSAPSGEAMSRSRPRFSSGPKCFCSYDGSIPITLVFDQNGREIAHEGIQLHQGRRADLLVAVGDQFLEVVRGAIQILEEQFGRLPGRTAADIQQPLRMLPDVVEQPAACQRDFRGNPPDRFHPVRLAKSVLEDTKAGEIFDGNLDNV